MSSPFSSLPLLLLLRLQLSCALGVVALAFSTCSCHHPPLPPLPYPAHSTPVTPWKPVAPCGEAKPRHLPLEVWLLIDEKRFLRSRYGGLGPMQL
ncbi:unnamed protein product [Lampetra planeri]